MDTDEVPDQLKCPVCFEVPDREIFLCKNGHTICKQCCANVPHCPQCRVPYEEGKVRCRPLESLLDTLKISCPHKENGCQEKIVVKTLKRHSENCIHNGHCILFCRQLGFPCEFWVNTLSVSKAVEHFQQNHDFLLLEETRVAIHMENFRDCCLRRNDTDGFITDSMWQPMLLKQDTSSMASSNNRGGPTFLILSLVNGEDETLSWLCLSIGDASISSHMEGGYSGKYQVEFRIKNKSKEVTELQWKVPPTEILLSKVAIQTPSFRVPIELLLNHYTDDDGSLLLNVFITRNTAAGGSVALDEVEMAEVAAIATLEPIWTFNVPFKRESSSRPRHRPPSSTNNTGLNLNLTVPSSSSSNLSSGQGQNPLSLLDGTGSTGKKLLNAANQQINQNMEVENLPCASTGMFGALGKRSQEGRQHMQKLVQQLIDGRNDNNEPTTTSDPNSADASLLSPIDESSGVVSSTSLGNEEQQQNQAQHVLPLQSLFGDNPVAFRGPPTDNQAGSSGGGGRAFDFAQQTSTTVTSVPFTLTRPAGPSTATVAQGDNSSNISGRKIKKPVRRFF